MMMMRMRVKKIKNRSPIHRSLLTCSTCNQSVDISSALTNKNGQPDNTNHLHGGEARQRKTTNPGSSQPPRHRVNRLGSLGTDILGQLFDEKSYALETFVPNRVE